MKQVIIQKMKNWIKPLSFNQIKCILPEKLKREIGCSDEQLIKIIKLLYDERIIKYRYKFICNNCNNECIGYERVMKKNGYMCEDCGKLFLFDEIKVIAQVVYEFDKIELLKFDDNKNIDFTKISTGDNVLNLRDYKENLKGNDEMCKVDKKIFFGSSTAAIDEMYNVSKIVGKLEGYKTKIWENCFGLAGRTVDSLIKVAKEVDGAIFIFSDDDEMLADDSKKNIVRDNVLFEYGLFMGLLGKEKVTFMRKEKVKVPSDLNGITYGNLDDDDSVLRDYLKTWLNDL